MRESKLERLFNLIGAEFDNKEQTFIDHCKQMAIVCKACFSNEEIEGKKILDAGCGTGTACIYFARNKAQKVIGLDLSPKSLEIGRRWADRYCLSNIAFQRANLLNLPFEDSFFDIVFSCGVIPYISNVFAAINELIRVTKKNGTILLFLLRKSKADGVYEKTRFLLSKLPISFTDTAAKILAVTFLPISSFFLKRKVNCRDGKPLEQTILENLFSPVALSKLEPGEVYNYFGERGFEVDEISGIKGVNFYSPETIFICKAKRS